MNEWQQRKLYIALYNAIHKENVEQVRQLIADGVDVNTVDNGKSPLCWAVSRGHVNIARVLIEAGADINIVNEQLFSALEENDIKKVRRLIAVGINVDIANKNGCTPLNRAAQKGNTDMVKTLINGGADVNIMDRNGYTPLSWAAIQNHTEVIETLINEGADINIADKYGSTPLGWAAGIDRIIIVELIVNHIAKLEAASLDISKENLDTKDKFINTSDDRGNDYLQYLENCKEEVKKIKGENKPLHDFLKESNINGLASIWEKNESICSLLDDRESLKRQYPEYAHILINKANEVKKEIFLHNHKPLIDALSTHYGSTFQAMTFTGMRKFFEVHENDLKEGRIGVQNNTLGYFVDLEDITKRHVPTLKVKTFAETIRNKDINSNLEYPSAEQTQEANQSLN